MPNFVQRAMKLVFYGCHIGTIFVTIVILCALPRIHADTKTRNIEDEYNEHYGNVTYYRYWKQAKYWYIEDGEPLLRELCEQAHRLSGKGSFLVNWVMWRERTLIFKNPKWATRKVDVVQYAITTDKQTTAVTDSYKLWVDAYAGEKWAIAEGRTPDCIYYLNYEGGVSHNETFSLKEEVCGINVVEVTKAPINFALNFTLF